MTDVGDGHEIHYTGFGWGVLHRGTNELVYHQPATGGVSMEEARQRAEEELQRLSSGCPDIRTTQVEAGSTFRERGPT